MSRTGKNVGRIVDGVRVLSLTDIGYGTGAGFRGWNCRHDWHPYFEGYSTLNYTDEQLAKLDEKNIEYGSKMYSQYEISQMQRTQERKIRELKRQTVKMQDAADFATDPKLKELAKADHRAMSVKLKTAEKKLKDFCKATGQDRDKFREQVLGFSRSQAQKAVWANKKDLKEKEERVIIKEIKACGFKGIVHITPPKLKTNSLSFDSEHINERNHNVSKSEAISFIKNAKFSVSRWNGKYENFYSDLGATFVDVEANHIRTSFKNDEFTEQVKKALEVIKKYGI